MTTLKMADALVRLELMCQSCGDPLDIRVSGILCPACLAEVFPDQEAVDPQEANQ